MTRSHRPGRSLVAIASGIALTLTFGMSASVVVQPEVGIGIDSLFWWDGPGDDPQVGVGMSIEVIPSDGPVAKPDDYVAGTLPPGGPIDTGRLDAMLQRGSEFNDAVLEEDRQGPFFEP